MCCHDDLLRIRVDRSDRVCEQQCAAAIARPHGERGGMARVVEPGLLDPANQTLPTFDAESVTAL